MKHAVSFHEFSGQLYTPKESAEGTFLRLTLWRVVTLLFGALYKLHYARLDRFFSPASFAKYPR